MARRTRMVDLPKKIVISEDEKGSLEILKNSKEWVIYKNVLKRYIRELEVACFSLASNDTDLNIKHADLTGQAEGMEKAVNIVDEIFKDN